MPSRHQITERPATQEELDAIRPRASQLLMGGGCLSLPVVAVAFGLGWVVAWLIDEAERTQYALVLALVVLCCFFVVFYRAVSRPLARRREALRLGTTTEMEVETDEAIELPADHHYVDPTVLIPLGEERVLLLYGQWLKDPAIYGLDASDVDKEDDPIELNGLPSPHSFPSRRFRITRCAATGTVFAIRVEGDYLSPDLDDSMKIDAGKFPMADSLLLECDVAGAKKALGKLAGEVS